MSSSHGRGEALPQVTLDVAVVIESQSLWTEKDIDEAFQKTNKILAACGISVRPRPAWVSPFDKIIPDYESTHLANQLYDSLRMPIVFLVNGVRYNQSAGFSPGEKYLFLSIYSRNKEYKKMRAEEYEPLAHEFGHMLGNLQHLHKENVSNLMAGYISQQSSFLDNEQCVKMRAHRHINNMNNFQSNQLY
jgi:hypothetical protein